MKQPVEWAVRCFEEFAPGGLYRVMQLRQAVFALEQRCLYRDLDDLDQCSLHLCGWAGETLAGYARCLPPGLHYPESSIGRIAVAAEHRGTGLGRSLVERAIALNRDQWPDADILIGAQAYLELFYREFGFERVSDDYDEDGITHLQMRLRVGSAVGGAA